MHNILYTKSLYIYVIYIRYCVNPEIEISKKDTVSGWRYDK